jgi:hypothetical protein
VSGAAFAMEANSDNPEFGFAGVDITGSER